MKGVNLEKQFFSEVLIAAAGFSSSIFLFLPLVAYLLNLDSVATPKMTILFCGGVTALVSACILASLSFMPVIGPWIKAACQIGLITVVVLTVFPNRTGELSGFDSALSQWNIILAYMKLAAICCVGVWLAILKPRQLQRATVMAATVVIAISCYAVLIPLSSVDKQGNKQPEPPAMFTRLGSASNIVVIVFDGFTGYRMTEILKEFPLSRSDFDGFVNYPLSLSSAHNSMAGLGAILTGDLKTSLLPGDNNTRMNAHLRNSFLEDARRKGLTTGFISGYSSSETKIPACRERNFFHQYPLSVINRLPSYLGFLTTSASRIIPEQTWKSASAQINKALSRFKRMAVSDWELLHYLQSPADTYCLAGKMAINHFIDNLHVTNGSGSALFIHTNVTHSPLNLDANGAYLFDTDRGDYETPVYAVRELSRLCAKLRSLGVYDSTLIIAVADHGGVPIKDMTMGGRFTLPNVVPAVFNPLLMVKPPGSHGPYRESSMTAWNGDVAATVRDVLGLPVDSKGDIDSRSLLKPELPGRKVNMPVFFRPDQVVSRASSLSVWARQNFAGSFQEYETVFSAKPEKLLERHAKVKLSCGIDKMAMTSMRWRQNSVDLRYRAAIEADGRLLTKLVSPGIAVITGKASDYKTKQFTDVAEGIAFIKGIPPDQDVLAVGLNVPSGLASELFRNTDVPIDPKTLIGFAAVSGPSYGPMPKTIVSTKNIDLDIDWKP